MSSNNKHTASATVAAANAKATRAEGKGKATEIGKLGDRINAIIKEQQESTRVNGHKKFNGPMEGWYPIIERKDPKTGEWVADKWGTPSNTAKDWRARPKSTRVPGKSFADTVRPKETSPLAPPAPKAPTPPPPAPKAPAAKKVRSEDEIELDLKTERTTRWVAGQSNSAAATPIPPPAIIVGENPSGGEIWKPATTVTGGGQSQMGDGPKGKLWK